MAEMLKENAQRLLSKVPEEKIFWCQDGRVFTDMKELAEALTTMTDEFFSYHSNVEKKDFINWVRDVIGDEKLAKDLEQATSRTQAAEQVSSRVDVLNRQLSK